MIKLSQIPQGLAIGLVRFYQYAISPLFPSCCRYYPSCSAYSLLSFKRFGFCKGLLLTIQRLGRCRPFGGKGYDPVPETWEEAKQARLARKQVNREK